MLRELSPATQIAMMFLLLLIWPGTRLTAIGKFGSEVYTHVSYLPATYLNAGFVAYFLAAPSMAYLSLRMWFSASKVSRGKVLYLLASIAGVFPVLWFGWNLIRFTLLSK